MTAASTAAPTPEPAARRGAFLGLALASAGVVYGDIGTSPLYAFKESIAHLKGHGGTLAPADVAGVISLMLWALMIIVTLKYVLVLTRFDNRGEGGTLSLMAKVRKAGGRGGAALLVIGMLGAGLFFGDAMLTPAISVLSAVEGLKVIEPLSGRIDPFVVPIALAVLAALFLVQRHGTTGIGRWFGPICLVWFAVLAALGVAGILRQPAILAAISPLPGIELIARHPLAAPAVMGSVFLTVTGAEALYADMGHFGRGPIQATWLALVFPCLALNYLGQGGLVLDDNAAAASPFFLLAPEVLQLPLVLLATAATVIASQAVISGAFSLAQQAIQLGLLPRLTLTPTSEHHSGQIYAPQINWLLMAGVAILVVGFGSSSDLAHAYGISVVGAMVTSSILAVVAIHRLFKRPIWQAILLFTPFLAIETVFLSANLVKVAHGGYVPLIIAAVTIFVMWAWTRGHARLARAEQSGLSTTEVIAMLTARPPMRAKGTAVFLTADPAQAPASLLHNLKHNQVLHEQIVLLTVRFASRPRLADGDRCELTDLAPGFRGLTLTYGFMETPDVAHGLSLARAQGLQFDILRTSFFLSRRTLLPRAKAGLAAIPDGLFRFLNRNAVRAADYFQLPPSRVVELGAQMTV